MTNRLWVKLMGAFALVIVVGVIVTVVLARQGSATQFSHFMVGNQMVTPEGLQSALAEYYVQHNGWNGIDAAVSQALSAPTSGGMMGGTMGSMMGMFDSRIQVVGTNGVVLADSAGSPGGHLDQTRGANSWPITVDGVLVGYLLFDGSTMTTPNVQSSDLLASVTRAVVSAALVAAVVALVLGGLLVRQITRPLEQLSRASHQVAAGDLTARVPVHGNDEIGQLAGTFNLMAASLQSQELLRRQMVADIAHELRTPLAGIQGTIEALQDGVFELTPEGLEPVHEQVMLLNRLVTDLRTLSQTEEGNLALNLAPVDPFELVKRQIELYRTQAASQGVELTLTAPAPTPSILGDEQRLDQVLGNLLGNALRHTPAGGTVSVQIHSQDGAVRIGVVDTGDGIASGDLERVFVRFYRPDSSRSRGSGGSGLGLAIARRLVEAHQGRIWAESPPAGQDQGSAFYVELREIT